MPERGPAVFLDYDQAALDAAHDQAAYAPNREQLIRRRTRHSELARRRAESRTKFAEDSSLEGGVSCELVSEVKFASRAPMGRFHGDCRRAAFLG